MNMNYKVTCHKCKSSRDISIINNNGREIIDWLDNDPDPQRAVILSARKRLDGNWGFSCVCGNDDIMTDQEKNQLTNHQNPDPMEVGNLVKRLKEQKPKFEMRTV